MFIYFLRREPIPVKIIDFVVSIHSSLKVIYRDTVYLKSFRMILHVLLSTSSPAEWMKRNDSELVQLSLNSTDPIQSVSPNTDDLI